jgi:hypothetical protein
MTELNSLLFYPKNSGNRAKQHDWAGLYPKKTKNSLLIPCLTGNLYGRHAAKRRFEKIGVLGLETGYSQRVPEGWIDQKGPKCGVFRGYSLTTCQTGD